MNAPAVCIDFETNWEKDVFSVSDLGEWNYTHDPRFDAYLVSVVGNGIKWVGHPRDFNWELVRGCRLIAHNARFDQSVMEAIAEKGVVPTGVAYQHWGDTADLSAYSLGGRSLAEASETLLGPQAAVDKRMRGWMSGKTWADAEAAGKATALKEYALNDSVRALEVWDKYSGGWSDFEQRLSTHTRLMTRRGININVEETERIVAEMEETIFDCTERLPWVKREGAKAGSADALKAECRMVGIEPPQTTADADPRFVKWLDEHSTKVPFVAAFKELKKVNSHLGRLQTMLAGVRRSDARWSYGLKYYGTLPTGRWAGADGANVQNQSRDLVLGKYDVRGLLVPKPGHKFVILDFSAIEVVVAAWYTGDKDLIAAYATGQDIYEAYARSRGIYKGSEPLKAHKELRGRVKLAVLGCAYSVGAARLAAQYDGLSMPEAQKIVSDYRKMNPKITGFWSRMERPLHEAVRGEGEDRKVEIELPSGRVMRYLDVRKVAGQFMGKKTRTKKEAHTNLYGGRLFNALIQGTARDILGEAVLRIEAAGFPVVLTVHDEVVVELREEDAAEGAVQLQRLMETSPEWAKTMPLKSEPVIANRYGK